MKVNYEWLPRAIELKREGRTWKEIATAVHLEYDEGRSGLDIKELVRGQVRRNIEVASQTNLSGDYESETISQTYNSDGTLEQIKRVCIKHGQRLTPNEILELHGLDKGLWEILSYTNNNWQMVSRDEGKVDLFQSKVKARPILKGLALSEIDAHFAEMQNDYVPPAPCYTVRNKCGAKMAEVNLADMHFGKLAWHGDTGADYDHKIATAICKEAIERICSELLRYDLEYIYFVWTNDFFNSDTITNTTTGGTPQDVDCRWQKMFNAGCDLLVWIVEQLRTIAPVKTFYTASNHDQMTAYYAIRYLSAWFKNDEFVDIDFSATPRKYVQYGSTLLGFGHGDKEGRESLSKDKASRLASCMPLEARELWGQTYFHEFHAAHLHSEQMIQEINGVIVRRTSSPTGSDTFHSEYAWLGAVRKVQTFIWDKEFGNEAIFNTVIRRKNNAV